MHKHTCAYTTYLDIHTLFNRNKDWDDAVEKYLNDAFEKCDVCCSSLLPKLNCKVSLRSIIRELDELACVHRFHLNVICALHDIHLVTRHSTYAIV